MVLKDLILSPSDNNTKKHITVQFSFSTFSRAALTFEAPIVTSDAVAVVVRDFEVPTVV